MPVPKDIGDLTAYQLQTEQKSDLSRFSGKTEISMTPDLLLLVAHMHLMPSTGEGSQHAQVLHDRVSESHWQVCRVELSPDSFSPVLPTTPPSPENTSLLQHPALTTGQRHSLGRRWTCWGLAVSSVLRVMSSGCRFFTLLSSRSDWWIDWNTKRSTLVARCSDVSLPRFAYWRVAVRPGCQRWWQLWGFFSFIKGDYF